MTYRLLLPLALLCVSAWADDAKPLPLRRSVILSSGGTYFVEGRQTIKWGQELSIQNNTRIEGRGANATLVVSGALQVRGVDGKPVRISNLIIELAEKCERVHFEAVKLSGCEIRTAKEKRCVAHLHLEEVEAIATPINLLLRKGEVTVLNSKISGAFTLKAEAGERKGRSVVKVLFNTSNIERDVLVTGLNEFVLRGCSLTGTSMHFVDCAILNFDGNIVKSTSVVFEQTAAGKFKKTKLGKCDFHATKLVFKAPRVGKKKDKIPVDKCWFRGITNKKEILASFISDGSSDEKSGAYVIFRKINKRELKLGGRSTQRGK